MASNVTNQSCNVLSKKVMVKKEELMNNITLFSIITVMSFILLAPAIIFMEGVKFTPTYIEAAVSVPSGLTLPSATMALKMLVLMILQTDLKVEREGHSLCSTLRKKFSNGVKNARKIFLQKAMWKRSWHKSKQMLML
ncbi:uncharacterized protein LOC110711667 [Chenopodium quinoa]|uniref:uncharacterized protein LOC110711667 n=1 Tax=Chenopodium quinoa TaxID=63459 RepID=UPI000B797E4A|nr:uncharacterized protein LOC110711667 [Chenopodium quinoa]